MDQAAQNNIDDGISIKELIFKIRAACIYLINNWKIICLIGFLGAVIGVFYSIYKKPQYIATCTFVLENNGKSGSIGQYAGLASLVGFNVGGGSGEGIFQGDNILQLYMSRMMIQKTLLSDILINGKKQLLINKYLDLSNASSVVASKRLSFNGDPQKFSRQQDSVLINIIGGINKMLYVDKLDKKSDIIVVKVTAPNEFFAKIFADMWVQTVNEFYIKTKTKSSLQSVQILQKQADSIKISLNSSISGVASSIDATPNANPLLSTLRVSTQKKQIDMQSSITIYSEVVKNLEIAKMSLRQETPLIQVIDEPIFPLPIEKFTKIKGILIGGVAAGFLTIIALLIKKILNKIVQ